jgi:putative hydrolases of HD superfamily
MKNVANLIFEAAVVKRLKRTGWQIFGDNDEEVGEHTFMTAVIAYFLAKEIHKTKKENIDMEKVLVMSIFHDFHEARTGEMDKVHKFYTSRDQDRANRDIFGELDAELLAKLNEYEKKESKEAKIVYEANIIALLVECKLLLEKGNTHAKEWLDANSTRLRIPEAVALAKQLASSDSHDWWKDIRDKLHEEYAR